MRKLKLARAEKNISQQELAQLTRIPQPAISNLENGIFPPSKNQKVILEQALGPIDWPEGRELSSDEKGDLIQAFVISINRLEPLAAVSIFGRCKNNQDLRALSSLFYKRHQ